MLSEGGRVRGAEGERDDLLQLHIAGEVANLGPVVAPVPRRETKDPQPQLARIRILASPASIRMFSCPERWVSSRLGQEALGIRKRTPLAQRGTAAAAGRLGEN